jgi:hypothetical protein
MDALCGQMITFHFLQRLTSFLSVENVEESDVAVCGSCDDLVHGSDNHVNNWTLVACFNFVYYVHAWQLNLSKKDSSSEVNALASWLQLDNGVLLIFLNFSLALY